MIGRQDPGAIDQSATAAAADRHQTEILLTLRVDQCLRVIQRSVDERFLHLAYLTFWCIRAIGLGFSRRGSDRHQRSRADQRGT